MTSKKKINSNRHNAKKSTGPKSKLGKANSSKNSKKHGYLSNKLTDTPTMTDEEKNSYEGLRIGLRETLQPANILEELLVELAATKYWRLQSILEQENARVEKALRGEKLGLFGGYDPNQKFTSWEEVPSSHFLLISKAANAVINEIRENDKIIRASFSVLSQLFDQVDTPTGSEKKGFNLLKDRLDRGFNGVKAPSIAELSKELFIEFPEDEKESLITLLEGIRDDMEVVALLKHPDEVLDTAIAVRNAATELTEQMRLQIRYETSLENGFYRAVHELQRVQAFRLGKNAPIPVAVDIQSPDGSD